MTAVNDNLPACQRRFIHNNMVVSVIYCKPSKLKLNALSVKEKLANLSVFQTRAVTPETCLACLEFEIPTPTVAYTYPNAPQEVSRQSLALMTYNPEKQTLEAPAPEEPVERKPPTLKEDGTLVFEKVGWEPPPLPIGYTRESNDPQSIGAWTLVPKVPLCRDLNMKIVKNDAGCKCYRLELTCNNNKQPLCETCPDRKPK